jgi:hypothetical protein
MSIYSRATLGEPDNQIVFNDYTLDTVYRITSRAPQRFQIRQEDFPTPFVSGISDFQTLIGETTYAIQGKMYPKNEAAFDTGLAALRAVGSLELQQADPYSSDGYVPYVWGEALQQKQLFVKVLYVRVTEDTRQGFVQPFTIICKIKDPTIYGSTLKVASTAQSSSSTTTGSANYPFKYPIAYGSTVYTVSSTATNVGTLPGYPLSIQIFGPVTNPTITNTTTGKYITVNSTLSSGSDVMTITYNKDSLSVTLNGVSVLQNVTGDSTWFKLNPGGNVIQLSGQTVSNGAYAVCNYYDTWSLA